MSNMNKDAVIEILEKECRCIECSENQGCEWDCSGCQFYTDSKKTLQAFRFAIDKIRDG